MILSFLTFKIGYSTPRTGTLKKKIVADYCDSHEDSTSVNNDLNGLKSNHDDSKNFLNNLIKNSKTPSTTEQSNLKNNYADLDDTEININNQFNEFNDYGNNWPESCPVGGEIKKIDMKVIEPYTRVLSHAGYYTNNSEPNIGGRHVTLFLFLLLLFFLFYKTLN